MSIIEAEVHRNDQVIMTRTFNDPNLSLERVLKNLEMYIVYEQLNIAGECLCRVRFSNFQKAD